VTTDARRTIGALGELIAEQHLARAGYGILDRNFRTRYGELDLVASEARFIVFCEVKTRVVGSRTGPPGPLDAIGPSKRRQLRRMAAQWLASSGGPSSRRERADELRFDAIGVTVSSAGRLLDLEHVRNAF
jgi:putative endonuclease